MRIIHIVPYGFDYFDDIKKSAFDIIDRLADYGIENEIITLQYQTITRRDKQEAAEVGNRPEKGPTFAFKGVETLSDAFAGLRNFDIIHAHCPLLGAARKICQFKKHHPAAPLVASYYREVRLIDFFSLIISLYNSYYLPRIFRLADAVTCFSGKRFGFNSVSREKVIDLSVDTAAPADEENSAPLTENIYKVKLDGENAAKEMSIDKLVYIYSLFLRE